MRTTFSIHYATAPGERIEVDLGGRNVPLDWVGDGWWSGEAGTYRGAPYRYQVLSDDGVVIDEPGAGRTTPTPASNAVTVVDRWRDDDPAALARRSALFRKAITARHPAPRTTPPTGLTFRVLAPEVPAGWRLAVLGSTPALGYWDPAAASVMSPAPFPWWQVSVDAPETPGDVEYKYVLIDDSGDVIWEGEDNRTARVEPDTTTVVSDEVLEGVPAWRGAGVAVPVFALRTARSLGVGQFTDLIPFADWAADAGCSVIQLLPVNDTVKDHNWGDSYPYDVVSVRALHPVYIDLEALEIPEIDAGIAVARADLEPAATISYESVIRIKDRLLRSAYAFAFRNVAAADTFVRFVEREWEWLGPYAMWCVLRDRHGTADHDGWGDDRTFDPDRLEAMRSPGSDHRNELRFHCWVQFHLHRQLESAADHARRRGVGLKGDLPIGVSPTSVEVWAHPELFHLGAQAGAPPDAFAVTGQNWGFPTYDWDRMAEDGYRWWRQRFTAMSDVMDAYRIDHVLGFFRIWEVPPDGVDGLLGRFRPCLPLSTDEVTAYLGVDLVDSLLRPTIDDAVLDARFGQHAGLVRAKCLTGPEHDLVLTQEFSSQRRIVEAFDAGLFATLPADQREHLRCGLLDTAADVLLLRIDDGYHPRISWEATETYRRLDDDLKRAFDTMANDFFHERHRSQWEQRGRITLPPVVDATDMLACGEDLGMVPDFVPGVMNDLGLLSLEIERMPKTLGARISDPARAPYLSVVSPGTHDMPPLREWWATEREAAAHYWNAALGFWGDPPESAAAVLVETVVRRHLDSPAMLAVIPVADLLAIDDSLWRQDGLTERINDPANRHHNWQYRLHLTVEQLHANTDFTQRVRGIIGESGR